MKRLIFLKPEDSNPDNKKLKAADLLKSEEKVLAAALKEFSNGIKEHKFISIVTELPNKPQVVIEFPEDKYHEAHDILRKLDIVELIDAILPKEDSVIQKDFEAKLAKFKK
jgi:hypothetical protein